MIFSTCSRSVSRSRFATRPAAAWYCFACFHSSAEIKSPLVCSTSNSRSRRSLKPLSIRCVGMPESLCERDRIHSSIRARNGTFGASPTTARLTSSGRLGLGPSAPAPTPASAASSNEAPVASVALSGRSLAPAVPPSRSSPAMSSPITCCRNGTEA